MRSAFADSEFEETIDSQLTLGTASLLSIFFGLVMVCGIFFGVGYSYGRRGYIPSSAIAPKPAVIAAPVQTIAKLAAPAPLQLSAAPVALPDLQVPTAAIGKVSKPVPMVLPAVSVPVVYAVKASAKTAQPASTATVASLTPAPLAASALFRQVLSKPSAIHPVMEEPTVGVPYAHRIAMSPNALRSPSTPYIYTPPFYVHTHGTSHHPVFTATHETVRDATRDALNETAHATIATPHEVLVVQIAAMSRQDDAEVLASSLRKRGFATSIHCDTQDSLYHVQVGPYQRNVALAARQKLIANGYNAVLK